MITQRRGSGPGARWGWLLTTLALGLALAVASWANYRSARDAVSTLHLGQVGVFEGAVMGALRSTGRGTPEPHSLDSLVTAHADAGLRFVGLLDQEGELVILGGTPDPEPLQPPRRDREPGQTRVGDRIRTFLPGPPGRSEGRNAPRSYLVVEFEPVVAGQLVNRAFRSLLLGAAGAGLLMAMALLFWRASLRREAEALVMEEQKRLSTLGELSAVLAHEIRNPLASLKGHAQLLAERMPEGAPERGKVDRIVTEALRLEALTTDLLDFVRTGPLDLRPTRVDELLRRAAAEVGGGSATETGAVGITLSTEGAPESWPVDPQRMHQVLCNVLRNAVEASPEGTPVEVEAAAQGGTLTMVFRDRGPGIPAEHLERIFEPFFTTRTRGTGLGLAVARRIVELHGGTLRARNHPGGGAELLLTLPRKDV